MHLNSISAWIQKIVLYLFYHRASWEYHFEVQSPEHLSLFWLWRSWYKVKPRQLEEVITQHMRLCFLANRQLHQQKEAENGGVFCHHLLFPSCYLHWWVLFPFQLMFTQQKGYQQAHLTKQWNLELVLWVIAFRYFPVTMAQIFWFSIILVSLHILLL